MRVFHSYCIVVLGSFVSELARGLCASGQIVGNCTGQNIKAWLGWPSCCCFLIVHVAIGFSCECSSSCCCL